MGKKNGKIKYARAEKTEDHPAVVCTDIIGQTEAFTAPRGRLEMGGLLLGHVDEKGNNVAVCGFFPKQTEESSGYCEFNGMYNAIAAAACDYANETVKGDEIPKLRIIGWIHTHPDIGIFLSGIDVDTFRMLRNQCHNRRFMAVVVDPLRGEHGVFLTERKARNFNDADGMFSLNQELEGRYHALLDRLRSIQKERGLDFLPCILPGHLRGKRNAMGDRDDIEIELRKGFFQLKKRIGQLSSNSNQAVQEGKQVITSLQNQLEVMRKENRELRQKTNDLIGEKTHAVQRFENLEARLLSVEKGVPDLKEMQLEFNKAINLIRDENKHAMNTLQQDVKESQLRLENEIIKSVKAVIRGARLKAKMYTDKQLETLREDLRFATNGKIDITTDKSMIITPLRAEIKLHRKKLGNKE